LRTDAGSGTGFYDGFAGRIHYRWWTPPDPRRLVLVAHGFGDHSGRWERFAQRLVGDGNAVKACDHRGHGLSGGARATIDDFGVVAAEYLMLLDAAPALEGVPVVLLGHSMGGIVAVRAATSGTADHAALVVSGARIGGWPEAESLLGRIDQGELDPRGPRHPLLDPDVALDSGALSRDPAIGIEFAGDELAYIGPFPEQTLRAYVRAGAAIRDLDHAVRAPVLYMHGGADPITPYRASVDRMMQIASDDLEVRIFAGARHSIYNETNRDEVFDVLLRFLERATLRSSNSV
jgi:alpha-beta hydrolase superfamily lysophospholipase